MRQIEIALELIRYYEGFRETAYQDTEDIWTIGTGFTYWRGSKVTESYPGRVTRDEDTKELCEWLRIAESRLLRSLPTVWPTLTANQKAAMISFSFNTGWKHGSQGFDSLNRCFSHNGLKNVPSTLAKYTNGGLLGLVRRRRAEGLVWYGQNAAKAVLNAQSENP